MAYVNTYKREYSKSFLKAMGNKTPAEMDDFFAVERIKDLQKVAREKRDLEKLKIVVKNLGWDHINIDEMFKVS